MSDAHEKLAAAIQIDSDIGNECQRLVDIAVLHQKTIKGFEDEMFELEKSIREDNELLKKRTGSYNGVSTQSRIADVLTQRINKQKISLSEIANSITKRYELYKTQLDNIKAYLNDEM